ncbi:hypothetical protein FRACA_1810005 [Frankia canadensis]|uniref:Uncharacterized protein n=1 Tax=Frankia canadensis TaxID=1836972 RepID=A0A2I2KNR6_9ACTN|nr:hypothetical protein FRACA_1810005 [Frankia canadensis]SOU54598.1 hypothetical protein FRACA_1810005 [Frankia canadensis]
MGWSDARLGGSSPSWLRRKRLPTVATGPALGAIRIMILCAYGPGRLTRTLGPTRLGRRCCIARTRRTPGVSATAVRRRVRAR